MSMRGAANRRTICEVLREINDELQGSDHQAAILPKLKEATAMAKKMDKKLLEYNEQYDWDFWQANPDQKADLKRRMEPGYIA